MKFIMFLIASIIVSLFRYMYNLMLNIRAITLCKSSLKIFYQLQFIHSMCVSLYCNQVHVTVFVICSSNKKKKKKKKRKKKG